MKASFIPGLTLRSYLRLTSSTRWKKAALSPPMASAAQVPWRDHSCSWNAEVGLVRGGAQRQGGASAQAPATEHWLQHLQPQQLHFGSSAVPLLPPARHVCTHVCSALHPPASVPENEGHSQAMAASKLLPPPLPPLALGTSSPSSLPPPLGRAWQYSGQEPLVNSGQRPWI